MCFINSQNQFFPLMHIYVCPLATAKVLLFPKRFSKSVVSFFISKLSFLFGGMSSIWAYDAVNHWQSGMVSSHISPAVDIAAVMNFGFDICFHLFFPFRLALTMLIYAMFPFSLLLQGSAFGILNRKTREHGGATFWQGKVGIFSRKVGMEFWAFWKFLRIYIFFCWDQFLGFFIIFRTHPNIFLAKQRSWDGFMGFLKFLYIFKYKCWD